MHVEHEVISRNEKLKLKKNNHRECFYHSLTFLVLQNKPYLQQKCF